MQELIKKADVLLEALPYIQSFYEKTVVIKYGGAAMVDPIIRRRALQDIVFMNYVGMRPILVHGGGPFINERLKKINKEVKFVRGFRATDEDTLNIVEEALTEINKDIVRELTNLGSVAISLSGKDDHLIMVKKHPPIDGEDIGFVGDVTRVNGEVLEKLVTSDIIPVIAPIGIGRDGYAYNVNADNAAAEIARELRALKFVLLTDVDGIMEDQNKPSSLITHLRVADIDVLIEKGIVSGGMIPKVLACLKALDRGVKKAHIINGKIPHALVLEIFTDKGIGTEIVRK
jgi:acetylglutamate kinase